MNKKRLSIILAIFFLVQAVSLPQNSIAENYSLNIPSRIADSCFRYMTSAAEVALAIYKMREFGNATRSEIEKQFAYGVINEYIKFDLKDLRLGKGGFTRYYPVSILGGNFIARVFLTAEEALQPKVKVVFEAKITDPGLTCQIIPDISSIIKDCKITPHKVYDNTEVGRSP